MSQMQQFQEEYLILQDDELLQLAAEQSGLLPEARQALQEEIRRRGLTKEAHNRVLESAEEPVRQLAPPVETFLNLTVLIFWIRELWLRSRTRHGLRTDAKVLSAVRTKSGYRSAARAELRYSYTLHGEYYVGRTVRDFMFASRAADSLAYGHIEGQTISVIVDPEHPQTSYYPSGFGWVDSLIAGSFGLLTAVLVLLIILGSVLKW